MSSIIKGGSGMEAFGIIGMSLGSVGMIFALTALAKIARLEEQLKAKGVLNGEIKSD
jgi:hypothetical protein